MPIVKPFIAGRRFVSTAATGTAAGADLTLLTQTSLMTLAL